MGNRKSSGMDRRRFLQAGAAAGVGVAFGGARAEAQAAAQPSRAVKTTPLLDFKVAPIDTVRIGFVGVGGMGSAHVQQPAARSTACEIRAVCDIVPEKVARIQKWVVEAGQPKPEGYSNGPEDFRRLCAADRPRPRLHRHAVGVARAGLRRGDGGRQARGHRGAGRRSRSRSAGSWSRPRSGPKRHCVMMENCCYDRPEMLCLNMVKKGLLGEILHAEGGYLHDLRGVKFSSEGEGLWRLRALDQAQRQPLPHPRPRPGRRSAWTSTAAIGSTTSSR